MSLHSPIQARERIQLVGAFGSGKSRAALALVQKQPDSRCWYLDTDRAALMAGDPPENMTLYQPNDWPTFANMIEKAHVEAGPNDWLILDRGDEAWDMIQDWYEEQKPGFREEAHGAGWGALNKLMRKRLAMMLTSFEGHVLVTGHVRAVTRPDRTGKGGDDAETIAEFGPHGARPAGWKHMMKYMHTILWIQQTRPQTWTLTTMRERRPGRERLVDKPVADWVLTYLVGTAGWRP